MTIQELEKYLHRIEKEIEHISRLELEKHLSKIMKSILFIQTLPVNSIIIRIRKDIDNVNDLSKSSISYIPLECKHNITKNGRANYEKQSIFYGSYEAYSINGIRQVIDLIYDDEIKKSLSEYFESFTQNKKAQIESHATQTTIQNAINETISISDDEKEIDYVASAWRLNNNIDVVKFVSSKIMRKSYLSLKLSHFEITEKIFSDENLSLEEKCWHLYLTQYLAEKFATKEKDNKNIYKLTSVIANIIYKNVENIGGIMYPSIYESGGLNVALLPSVISDNNIELINVTYNAYKNGKIDSLICDNIPKDPYEKFKWIKNPDLAPITK